MAFYTIAYSPSLDVPCRVRGRLRLRASLPDSRLRCGVRRRVAAYGPAPQASRWRRMTFSARWRMARTACGLTPMRAAMSTTRRSCQ